MHKDYYRTIAKIVDERQPETILDAPAGGGWLAQALHHSPTMDGIDLYEGEPDGYRSFVAHDLDAGLPADLPEYESCVCCEGIEHLANPGLLLQSFFKHLQPGGVFIVSTPNIWYPAARLTYLWRGFFPSFPSLAGKVQRGTHMHILPWSWPQLYLFLQLAGFVDICLHDVEEPKPKHGWERLLGVPHRLYCRSRAKRATNSEESRFWQTAGGLQSAYGRRLVVSACKAAA